uniref:ATPase family AAA domain containing 5a n=1 Tax=Electrophorus electricus TaxID=8005 RepID=A0A4W4EJJ3_ELEEL
METPTEHLVKGGGCICVPGNDTAALLSQISDIILDEEPLKTKNTETCVNDRTVKDVLPSYKGKTLDNPTQEGVNIGNDDASTREDKCRGGKSVVRKSKKSKASRSELCNAEHEQSLRDASLEVHVDETSILNCSTITVSFEDFLQSQKEEEDTAVPESDTSAVDALSITKNGSDMVFEAPQLSPRTLTVLAEVHPISPNHESAKGSELRIASIFSKTKKECQVKNLKTSSTNPLVSVDVLPDLKRKSNVVVQEEDLELFVVEASNSPKCTKEERKQFMNAFKQPSQDGAKGKSIKGSGTLKQAQEKVPETNEKEPGEKTAENMPDVTISQSMEPEDPSSVGKNGNKSVKKSRKDSSEDVSLPTPKQEELSTSVEMGMESGCTDEGNRRTARELRRSSRQHTCRQTTAVPKRDPSSCKTRSQKKAEGSAVSQEHPAQASTPRTHRPKKGVYRAEMLYPLDKRESPIRMKFTRLFPSSDTKAGEFEISSPLSVQESDSMKKRKRAKRLIQKAKALKLHLLIMVSLQCEPTAVETLRSWDLLSETERRGVNLLYTNLEVLLPLPTRPLPEPTLDLQPGPNPDPQPGLLARHGSKVENDENTANMSPLKVSSRMRQKKQLYADHKNALNSDSESDEGFLSLPNPNCDAAGDHTLRPAQGQEPRASKAAPVRVMRVKLADTERKKSKPVSQCLSSLAEYLDYVSFMDSALHFQPRTAEGACRPQSFNWTGAAVKSGMTDEVCLESGGYTSAFDSKEIHAMLGSLSFWKCRAGISKAWTVAQELEEQIRKEAVEELTLPIASHRQNFSLAQSTLCEPRVMEVRRDVMSTVLTNRSFCTLGNRLAAVMDHLPSLRTICRSERLKEQGRVKRRFMHYFNTINLDLPKSTIQQLGSDFP